MSGPEQSSRSSRGHLLIVSHNYPPSAQVAARRPHGLAKYLSRLGWEVTVLTSSAFGRAPGTYHEDGVRVLASRDLITSPFNWRRSNIDAIDSGSADYDESRSPLSRLVPPDPTLVTWVPYARRAAVRIAEERRVDCVITTSPPEASHLVARAALRRGARWIADLRDGWMFQPSRSWPLRAQERLDARLERGVMLAADAITAVTEPIAADLRLRYSARVVAINNGYDPEDFAVAGEARAVSALSRERHSFVYTGRLAYAGRSLTPLVTALRHMAERDPESLERIEVVLAGPLGRRERTAMEAAGVGEALRHIGTLPREEALEMQRKADTLLLIMGAATTSAASAKLYEYLAAGRPILVLGSGTEAARIVAEAGAGRSVAADDPEEIAAALASVARGEGIDTDLERLRTAQERFAYPRLAERFSELIEQVLADRRPHRAPRLSLSAAVE